MLSIFEEYSSKHNTNCFMYEFPGLSIKCYSNIQFIDEYIKRYINKINNNIEREQRLNLQYCIRHVSCTDLLKKFIDNIEKLSFDERLQVHKSGTYVKVYTDKGIRVCVCEQRQYVVIQSENKEDIYVITTDDDNISASSVLRIIREIIFRSSENDQGIIIHGAAAGSVNHNGILICGDKGSGKTSFLLFLLSKGFKFVANDRVLVKKKHNEFRLEYIPLAIRIGLGTIQSMSELKACTGDFAFSRVQPQEFIDRKDDILLRIGSSKKVELTPEELCKLFSVDTCSDFQLNTIVFPKFNYELDKVVVSKMDKEKAREILIDSCMTPYDANWLTPWLVKRKNTNQRLANDAKLFIYELLNQCQLIKVEFGDKALRTVEASEIFCA